MVQDSTPALDGRHDNYGSALTAQQGRSQGRPANNTSSRLIVQIGLPTEVLPVPLVPDHEHAAALSAANPANRSRSPRAGLYSQPLDAVF